MPTLQIGEAKVLRRDAGALFAIETEPIHTVDQAKFPIGTLCLFDDTTRTIDRWESDRPVERTWRPGDVGFIPANSVLASTAATPFRATFLSLNDRRLVDAARALLDNPCPDLRCDKVTTVRLTALTRAMQGMIASGEADAWPLVMDGLCVEAVVELGRFLSKAPPQQAPEFGRLSPERQARVIEHIEAKFSRPMRLQPMADAAALSPFHFSRSFKQTFGVSPSRYVLNRRLQEAQHLLKTTRQSLAEIALACGFASQSHFSTAFKTALGVTPRQFRDRAVTLMATISTGHLTDLVGTVAALA